MLCHTMQNKLLFVDGELAKDRLKGPEIRELNDTEKIYLTAPFLSRKSF